VTANYPGFAGRLPSSYKDIPGTVEIRAGQAASGRPVEPKILIVLESE
jgi:hypothetical protein